MVIFLSISRCIHVKTYVTLARISWYCNLIKSIRPRILKFQLFNHPCQFAGKQSLNSSTNTTTKRDVDVSHKTAFRNKNSNQQLHYIKLESTEREYQIHCSKTLPEPQLISDLTDKRAGPMNQTGLGRHQQQRHLQSFLTTGEDKHSLTAGDKRHYHDCHLRFLYQYQKWVRNYLQMCQFKVRIITAQRGRGRLCSNHGMGH